MSSEVRITDPKTGGQKGQKPERFDLIPFDALEEVARVYGVGAEKYEDDNWLKGYRWRLSLGALIRHVARFMLGEDRDPETGCLHLAHAAWHCLTVITFLFRGLGTDDRAKVEDEPPQPIYLVKEGYAGVVGHEPLAVGTKVRVNDKVVGGAFNGRTGVVVKSDSPHCYFPYWVNLDEGEGNPFGFQRGELDVA